MEDVDILTKIVKWCGGTTYITKDGNDIVRAYAKAKILEIINSEQ